MANGGYDAGIATDGDADRVGIADERGNFIDQLQVFGLLTYYLLETRGERTRGMSVFDLRPWSKAAPNVECVSGVDAAALRQYVEQGLGRTC